MTMPTTAWSRRKVLRAGALPFLGLGLPQFLAMESAAAGAPRSAKAKSCIFLPPEYKHESKVFGIVTT